MSELNLTPKQKALRKAVADYSEKTGVNAATIALVAEKFVGMLAGRWEHIMDVALADENEGKVKFGFSVGLDTTHKMPVGNLTLSFSQRTKDDDTFAVEDPSQPALPFEEAVRSTTSPSAPPNGMRVNGRTDSPGQPPSPISRPALVVSPTPSPSSTVVQDFDTGSNRPASSPTSTTTPSSESSPRPRRRRNAATT